MILGSRYTTGIDVWSAGCVIAEMLLGQPLFAGQDEADMLALMTEVCNICMLDTQ